MDNKTYKELFKTLPEFIEYCNEFLLENEENHDENYRLWLAIIADFKGNVEDLVKSYDLVIEMYYIWLKQAIKIEDYESCILINKSIQYEKTNYINLGYDLFKTNITKQIEQINNKKIK